MEKNARQRTRQRLVAAMHAGQSWQETARAEALPLNRAMAYRSVRILWGTDTVEVELKSFNDRALNRDVMILCTKVAQDQPHLPDGCRLILRLQGTHILHLNAQEKSGVRPWMFNSHPSSFLLNLKSHRSCMDGWTCLLCQH